MSFQSKSWVYLFSMDTYILSLVFRLSAGQDFLLSSPALVSFQGHFSMPGNEGTPAWEPKEQELTIQYKWRLKLTVHHCCTLSAQTGLSTLKFILYVSRVKSCRLNPWLHAPSSFLWAYTSQAGMQSVTKRPCPQGWVLEGAATGWCGRLHCQAWILWCGYVSVCVFWVTDVLKSLM